MRDFAFDDDCRRVVAAAVKFVNARAHSNLLLARYRHHARRYLASRSKDGPEISPRESFEGLLQATKQVWAASRAVDRLDSVARSLVKQQLAKAGPGKNGHTALKISIREIGRLRDAMLRAARDAKRRVGPGAPPENAALRELVYLLVRDWQAKTGRPMRVAKKVPEPVEDLSKLIPKVRAGAEARALLAVLVSIGESPPSKTFYHYLRSAKERCDSSKNREPKAAING